MNSIVYRHLAPMDSKHTRIESLPNEIIECILMRLDPRSIKCFSQTCKRFKEIAATYQGSRRYAIALVPGVISHLAETIKIAQELIDGGERIRPCFVNLAKIAVARKPQKKLSEWSGVELLNFLYPLSVYLPYWPESVYAFEWCVIFEKGDFQCELLSLLHLDAIDRLGQINESTEKLDFVDLLQHREIKELTEYMDAAIKPSNCVLIIAALAASNILIKMTDVGISHGEPAKGFPEEFVTKVLKTAPHARKNIKRLYNFGILMFCCRTITLPEKIVNWFRIIGVTYPYFGNVMN